MIHRRTALIATLALLCIGQAALLVFLHLRSGWQQEAGAGRIARGRSVAESNGCFGCHGPGGDNPIRNPGAAYGKVPGWGGDSWALWNDDEHDVRAWIVDGHPRNRAPDPGALIPMPAYGDIMSDRDLDDLVAYVLAVARFGRPDDPQVLEGRELAGRLGCLGCHGPEGRGLTWNPGSLKGYVPAWDSEDYDELVRDEEEFRQWVRNGVSDRFLMNPAARAFLDTQPIRMPAYGDHVTDEQLAALLAYVNWVRANPR
jgi:mono/diheme cytochrome c family protein